MIFKSFIFIGLATAIVASNTTLSADFTYGTIKHYPPLNNSISDLNSVFNPESGTNNGIYNSSFVDDENYGIYNFCNMPHVRTKEYNVPQGYKLEYVELIHRHHKRTPYASNVFPEEDIPLYCDDVTDYYYAQPNSFGNSVRIGWENYQDPVNPFSFDDAGFNGTCQFPQISFGGLQDSYTHGVDLYNTYGALLNFLPIIYDPNLVKYRVTENVITSQVAGALIRGMYPYEESIKALQQRISTDSLEPQYSCPFADDVKANYQTESSDWQIHLNESETIELFSTLDSISGVDPTSSGWHSWFDHYFDNLAHRTCHQFSLPCNISNKTDCITEEMAEQVFRLGDYEYNYIYRQALNSTLYSATHYGAFLLELTTHLKNKIQGSDPTIFRHNIAHDGSLSPLLGALQINFLRWPGMGSEVVFELWRNQQDNGNYIRILYGGQPLETTGPLGTVDMIKIEEFYEYIETLIGPNGSTLVELCSS